MENNVLMPRLGVNEDVVTLVQWLVKDGDAVREGEKIAVIETTKETSEVIACASGVIRLLVEEGKDVAVNNVIASIGGNGTMIKQADEKQEPTLEQFKLTEKAKVLIEKHHIDLALLPKGRLIREKDVLALVSTPYEIAPSMCNQILIYGGSGFGKIVISIIRRKQQYQVHGVLDIQYPEKKECLGVPVLGGPDILDDLYKEGYHQIVNAVGFFNRVHARKEPYLMLKEKGFILPNIIHERATIEEQTRMGEANIICAGAILGPDATIGNNCLINAGSVIAHDCIISDHCHIASGAVLAGGVIVGENTLIGQNCTVYNGVKIGKNVVIQNGCHIYKDVKDNEIVTHGK